MHLGAHIQGVKLQQSHISQEPYSCKSFILKYMVKDFLLEQLQKLNLGVVSIEHMMCCTRKPFSSLPIPASRKRNEARNADDETGAVLSLLPKLPCPSLAHVSAYLSVGSSRSRVEDCLFFTTMPRTTLGLLLASLVW